MSSLYLFLCSLPRTNPGNRAWYWTSSRELF